MGCYYHEFSLQTRPEPADIKAKQLFWLPLRLILVSSLPQQQYRGLLEMAGGNECWPTLWSSFRNAQRKSIKMLTAALSAVQHHLVKEQVLQQHRNTPISACPSSVGVCMGSSLETTVAQFLDFNPKEWCLTVIYLFSKYFRNFLSKTFFFFFQVAS